MVYRCRDYSGIKPQPPEGRQNCYQYINQVPLVQSKTNVLGVSVVCFLFVCGSGIAMALTAGNSTSIMQIYSVLVKQPFISISSPWK